MEQVKIYKRVIFKNCAPFTNCISEINNKQVDHTQDFDLVMPMYNLIEYSDVFSKTSASLWQYFRDKPVLNNNNNLLSFLVVTIVVSHLNLNSK